MTIFRTAIPVMMAILFAVATAGCDSRQARNEWSYFADNPLKLQPITMKQATELGAYARKAVLDVAGQEPMPVAWSWLNYNCSVRTGIVGLAAAKWSIEKGDHPVLKDTLSEEEYQTLKETPEITGTFEVNGPLISWQRMRDGSGNLASNYAQRIGWMNHVVPVVFVEGEYMILDLSVGDAPTPIDDWYQGIVEPSFSCDRAENFEQFGDIFSYWKSLWDSLEPRDDPFPRPNPACRYIAYGRFSGQAGQPLDVGVMNGYIRSQYVIAPIFYGELKNFWDIRDLGGIESIPFFLTRYQYGTEKDICELEKYSYCKKIYGM